MQLASTGQGSQWVIIFIFRLKSNFKKTNKSQQHYSNYQVVNDLFTRKIETILIRSRNMSLASLILSLPFRESL